MAVANTSIAIASDHGGVALKDELCTQLTDLGFHCTDLGPHSNDSVDYPDYAAKVARAVSAGEFERGILVCGSGIGMSIAANKVGGIRAAVVQDVEHARLAGEHNDANVLCLGGRFTAPNLAVDMVQSWLGTQCEGPRHHRRLNKISLMEKADSPNLGEEV